MRVAGLKRVVEDSEHNPYVALQQMLVQTGNPPFTKGFDARLGVLFGLLGYLIVVAVLLIGITAFKAWKQGRSIWLVRLIRRPQGRYLTLNQYFVVPLSCLMTAIVWTMYLAEIRAWWRTGMLSKRVIFWICLNASFPLAVGWLVTFSVLSGANLISQRKNETSRHVFGPRVLHTAILGVFPLSVVAILITSIRAGRAYERLDAMVLMLFRQAAADAKEYDGGLTELEYEGKKTALAAIARETLYPPYATLTNEYRIWSIVFLVCLSVLFVLNVIGGVLLLRSLRVMDNSPRSSYTLPQAPLVRKPTTLADTLYVEGMSPSKWEEDNRDDPKIDLVDFQGRQLDWDITLFYFSIGPACLILMGYAAWIAVSSTRVFHVEPELELATVGLEWLGSFIGAVALTIICYKRIRQLALPHKVYQYPAANGARQPGRRMQPSPAQSTPGDRVPHTGGFEQFRETFEDLSDRKSEDSDREEKLMKPDS